MLTMAGSGYLNLRFLSHYSENVVFRNIMFMKIILYNFVKEFVELLLIKCRKIT